MSADAMVGYAWIGNVQPCSYFPKFAGNVRQQSFKDIWENSELFKDLRDFKKLQGQVRLLRVCECLRRVQGKGILHARRLYGRRTVLQLYPKEIRKGEDMNDTFLKACRGEKSITHRSG